MRKAWKDCEKTFTALKACLIIAPALAYANFSPSFISEVEASHSGLGAALLQEQEKKVRPITYASRSLSHSERNMTNYSSMKLEFVALKWAVTKMFREYLLGQKCMVWMDNNLLSHLNTVQRSSVGRRS